MTHRPFRCLRLFLFAGLALLAAVRSPAQEARLTILYNGHTTAFAGSDLVALPHRDVTTYDAHEKQNHVYSGVPVRLLLAKAGIEFGEKLRGPKLRAVVIAHTKDHYDIVYALAEFDENFNARTILLVDRQDGQPLPDGLGPVRFVIPGDQRPARWARMVTSLEVVSVGDAGKR